MDIKTIGLDIAKNVFQLHGVDGEGQVILKKCISRRKLAEFIAKLPKCVIGMESCGSSNYWARKFVSLGHEVKLMSAQFVKPYVKSNKNDEADAEAICEAVTRPTMRFVAIKTVAQQDIQSIHRVRSLLVKEKVALSNQIRGLLLEYGTAIPQGIRELKKQLPDILEDGENELTSLSRELFSELREQFNTLEERIKHYDNKIRQLCESNEQCKKLTQLEGVGPLTATALMSCVGDASVFKNGREMAAFLGLVPRQYSSGGKQKLLGISKRGDRYVRTLLVHGARAVVCRRKEPNTKKSHWVHKLVDRRGTKRAIVALANKNARILWALMARKEAYQPI